MSEKLSREGINPNYIMVIVHKVHNIMTTLHYLLMILHNVMMIVHYVMMTLCHYTVCGQIQ